ncbi:hypothetical protein CCP3SC15_1770006 [Gammaproteobacteria bacterium]
MAEATRGSLGGFESPFEESVASALVRKGWELHTQIGASSFRVDLAVVHPDAPGIYLTGIECDGATYHRSATARDRDKLRERVLRGLGWEILRVWSTEWWIDAEGTLEKLDARLRMLLDASRARRAEEAARRAMERKEETIEIETVSGWNHGNVESESVEMYAKNVTEALIPQPTVFMEADPVSVVDAVDPQAFGDSAYDSTLERMIAHVVEVEGPVLDSVLARRIARAHGWQRTGAHIQRRVDALAIKIHRVTQEEDGGTFYWPEGCDPEASVTFRRSAGKSVRNMDEICMPELIALAREVLTGDKRGEEAMIIMARELGLQRLRLKGANRVRIERAMALVAKT